LKFQVLYKRTFLKELKKLPKDIRIKAEHFCFDVLPGIENLADIRGLENWSVMNVLTRCAWAIIASELRLIFNQKL